ncbi:ComEC/Rec2 family competence protein [Zavarzinia compransoris]|uniref:ComEC/Rec2 family competence protein n=1 Tax=Zavarzinia compransoris TaxID=1264899 RepID=UPI001414E79E|nr:ComEC/Rec2 family competence protein [Zavarzinia compransoris]
MLIGAGIGLYFALPVEPALHAAVAPAVLVASALLAMRRHPVAVVCLAGALAVAAGFAAIALRAHLQGTPVVPGRTGIVVVEGRVLTVEARPDQRPRLGLRVARATGLAPPWPREIRLSFDTAATVAGLAPGARIAVQAILLPPPGPALPGAPDHGRALWFGGIGAVGFATAAPIAIDDGAGQGGLAAWRQRMAGRIANAMDRTEGAIAAALMVGIRGGIPEAVEARWRAAGISHILSISGLHIGLAAGVVLFSLRFLLAAAGSVSLRYPVKKWAAAAAILAAGAYTVVAGLDVPAQRSFIMTAIVLVAVIADRLAITLRLVAIAAAVILLLEPESLTAPGFGMSFASVTALVAGFEAVRTPLARWRAQTGLFGRGGLALLGILLSGVLATVATAPFGVAHFGQFSAYGIVANLVAVPWTGFLVMPLIVVAALLMPFGAEGPVLALLGPAIGVIDALAAEIAALPGAQLSVPAMGQGALVLMVLAGLSLCLWRGRLRLSALAFLAAGLGLWAAEIADPPRLLIHEEGRAVATVRDGALVALPPASPRFVIEQWQERLGLGTLAVTARAEACEGRRCRLALPGGGEAVIDTAAEAAEIPCAAVVILTAREAAAPADCPGLVLGPSRLAGRGTLVIDGEGRLSDTAAARGRRPWTPGWWAPVQ